MKKKLAGTWKKNIGYWPVQMNGNKLATGQIPRKPVEVVKGRILAGWAPKPPEPCPGGGAGGAGAIIDDQYSIALENVKCLFCG